MSPADQNEGQGRAGEGAEGVPTGVSSPREEERRRASEKEPVAIVSEDASLRIKRGIVNFLAIFLGVSLSFLAEDWREDLNEVEDGLRSLQGILADIQQDLGPARTLARSDSNATEWGLWLHRNWERTALPEDSVDQALRALHSGAPYTPVRSEYESAKYAGRLQYLENQELRQDITELYESSQPLLVHVYDLRTDFTLELWRLLRPYESYATTFDGPATVPPVHLDVAWSELRSNTSLRNAVVESVSLRRAFSNLLRNHVRQSARLREAIRAELAEAGMMTAEEAGNEAGVPETGEDPPPIPGEEDP